MKIDFYMPMFLLMMTIPFFLIKEKNIKTDKVHFVKSKTNQLSRDTIKLFQVIDGKEQEYLFDFKIDEDQKAFFYNDTLGFNLIAGYLGGYNLSIEIVGGNYISKLTNYDCTWGEDLKIKNQKLELEDFELGHSKKLKVQYYCKAEHKNRFRTDVEKVVIRGYFEINLSDVNKIWKLLE